MFPLDSNTANGKEPPHLEGTTVSDKEGCLPPGKNPQKEFYPEILFSHSKPRYHYIIICTDYLTWVSQSRSKRKEEDWKKKLLLKLNPVLASRSMWKEQRATTMVSKIRVMWPEIADSAAKAGFFNIAILNAGLEPETFVVKMQLLGPCSTSGIYTFPRTPRWGVHSKAEKILGWLVIQIKNNPGRSLGQAASADPCGAPGTSGERQNLLAFQKDRLNSSAVLLATVCGAPVLYEAWI